MAAALTVPDSDPRILFKISEVAEMLDCSVPYVWKLIDQGELTALRHTRKTTRVTRESLDCYLVSLTNVIG